MRILVFYPYIPYPIDRGTYHRTFNLLRQLAATHDVDLLAITENGERVEHKPIFQKFCRRVEFVPYQHPKWERLFPQRLLNPLPATVLHWYSADAENVLAEMLATGNYDAVHVCDIVMANYFMRKHRNISIVIDRSRVDLQFQWMEESQLTFSLRTRLLRHENNLKLWFYERAVAKRASVEVVCGVDDEIFLHRYISSKMPVEVLPNGVDPEYFFPNASAEPRAKKPTILFCGAMDYTPNTDAMRWYFDEIHEPLKKIIPELRVLIVGKEPTEEIKNYAQKSDVIVTGEVPDVRPYYRRAWLQIVPIRIGGGSRLKIVESIAMGTPVVSTTTGAQGLGLRHERDILLADTADDFVRATARALTDEKLRSQLNQMGLEGVSARLTWTSLGEQLNALYAKLFGPRNIKPISERLPSGEARVVAQPPSSVL